jgi:hypothetical protein
MNTEPDGPDELILVHTASGGQGIAVFLKSLLESEGIHCVIKTDSGTVGFSLMPPRAGLPLANAGPGLFDVYVLDQDAQRAREILSSSEVEDDESSRAVEQRVEASFGPLVPSLLVGIGVCAGFAALYEPWRGDGLAWVFVPIAVVSSALWLKMR